METERTPENESLLQVRDDLANDGALDEARADMEAVFHHADQLLDELSLLNAENYLVQNRQTGGQ